MLCSNNPFVGSPTARATFVEKFTLTCWAILISLTPVCEGEPPSGGAVMRGLVRSLSLRVLSAIASYLKDFFLEFRLTLLLPPLLVILLFCGLPSWAGMQVPAATPNPVYVGNTVMAGFFYYDNFDCQTCDEVGDRIYVVATGDLGNTPVVSPSECRVVSSLTVFMSTSYSTPGSHNVTVEVHSCVPNSHNGQLLETASFTITALPVGTGGPAGAGSTGPQIDLPCHFCEATGGAPINLMNGDTWITQQDYSLPGLGGGISVARTWNSLWSSDSPVQQAGIFGDSWTSNLEERLQVVTGGNVVYWRGDGGTWQFTYDSLNKVFMLSQPLDERASLTVDSIAMQYTLVFKDGHKAVFNNAGYLISIVDRNGNAVTISVDAANQNRIATVTDPAGRILTFNYTNPQFPRLCTAIVDSVGTAAAYTYDGLGRLQQVLYPDGSQKNFSYDSSNLILSVTDSQGKVLESHTYDSARHGKTSSRANGVDLISLTYPTFTQLTNSLGATTNYQWAQIGQRFYPTGITNSSGPASGCNTCGGKIGSTFSYDNNGNRTSADNAVGGNTANVYDAFGNVLSTTTLLNGSPISWSYTYNGFGEVLTAKDPLQNTTTYQYDSKGNRLSVTTPSPDGVLAGSKTTFTYDTKGELTQVKDPLNHLTKIVYFSTGQINYIQDANNKKITYAYDGRGNLLSVTDSLAKVTQFTYDLMNRLTQVTYPTSTPTSQTYHYDYRGRRDSAKDQNGNTTIYNYDDADRLISVQDAKSNLTQYGYDTESNRTSVTDALQHQTQFAYSTAVGGYLVRTTFPAPDNHMETYNPDAAGRVQSVIDRNGNNIAFTYDVLNRLVKKQYNFGASINYTYDNDNRLTQVQDATGTYGFQYDNTGRLTQTTVAYAFLNSRTFTAKYTYDAASNLQTLTDPETGLTHYTYDVLNRLTNVQDFQQQNYGFSYDALNRRTQLTRPNGINTTYAYDPVSRLTSILHKLASSGAVLDGATYAYDNSDNRNQRVDKRTNTTLKYTYDTIYQLLSAKQGTTTKETYSYDAVGNRTSSLGVSPYSYNSYNELTTIPGITFGYDNNGNLQSKFDATGQTFYQWDLENRLKQVTLPGTGGTITYQYDPFGRRIEKITPAETIVYLYDGDNVLEEVDGNGAVLARYTQGPGIDRPLAEVRSGTTSYYEADALGSITSLSNSAGTLANTYSYDSFGKLMGSTGTLTNRFQYAGREFDAEAGIYYYRARYYDRSTGRFLSEDPTRFSESANFYPYVGSNPLTYKDPFGQGIVDCAAELAQLAYLEGKKAVRLAEQAAASCKDKNHQKSIDQLQNAIDRQRARVARHCSDAETKKQLLLMGAIALAVALAPETGGGSLVPALAGVF